MSKHQIFFTLLTIVHVNIPPLYTQEQSIPPSDTAATIKNTTADIATFAQILFNPTDANGQPDPYPTISVNQIQAQKFFGASGLEVSTQLMQHILNAYFYLEYCTKLQLAAQLAGLAEQYGLDVIGMLHETTTPWQTMVDQLRARDGSWDTVKKNSTSPNIKAAWSDITGTIPINSWKEILKSDFWEAIPITRDDLNRSLIWQTYLKYKITQSFSIEQQALGAILETEKAIFRYTPDIQVAYYHPDFTRLRTMAELLQLNLLLSHAMRTRFAQQSTDWQKISDLYTATQPFAQTILYQLLNTAQADLNQLYLNAATNQLTIDKATVDQNPLLQEQLTFIAMVQNIQAQLEQELFTTPKLTNSIQKLTNTAEPAPRFVLYTPDDLIYLQDRNELNNQFLEPNTRSRSEYSPSTKQTVMVQSFFDDIFGALAGEAKAAGSLIAAVGEEAGSLIVKGAGAIVGVVDPKVGKQLIDTSNKLNEMAEKALNDAEKNGEAAVDGLANATQDIINFGAEGLGAFVGLFDEKTGATFTKSLEDLGSDLVTTLADLQKALITAGAGLVRLSIDAVNVVGSAIADTVIAVRTADASIYQKDLWSSVKQLGANIASSVLESVSFLGSAIGTAFEALVKIAGYLTALITNIFIDIVEGFAYLGAAIFDPDANPSQVASQVGDQLNAHRRIIESIVTTGLLVGATILTGGAAAPLLAMTIGPQIFAIVGGAQQDEAQEAELAYQKQFLKDFQTFVTNNQTISQNQQDHWVAELDAKFMAEMSNQERQLGFYQNYVNDYFFALKDQMAENLGAYLAPQIKPDSSGAAFIDVGSMYGFTTGVYNFNPSQGFPLYCDARRAFSQEIATSPTAIIQPSTQPLDLQSTPEKFWFNQKTTIPFDAPIRQVHITWRALYTLSAYHLGIYFGGVPYDLAAILKTKKAPTNPGKYAKMLVYKKEASDQPTTLGLYEHEGAGWISSSISNAPSFNDTTDDVGTWYHMKMSQTSNQLSIAVWKEGEVEPTGQTFVVQYDPKNPPQTIGVISSGAALEYKIITPLHTVSPIASIRSTTDISSEESRQIPAQQKLWRTEKPALGMINLRPTSLEELVNDQFIYTTRDTKLTDARGAIVDDYVLLCQIEPGIAGAPATITPGSIGISVEDSPQALLSIVTGQLFDTKGIQTGTYNQDIIALYEQTYQPLSDITKQNIIRLQTSYLQQLAGPFAFNRISLQAASIEALSKGMFIYTASSPEKDVETDYFLMATLRKDNSIIQKGMAYNSQINGIVSMVTGLVYGRTSTTPLVQTPTGSRYTNLLARYQDINGALPEKLTKNIDAAAKEYQKKLTQQTPQKISPIIELKQVTTNDISSTPVRTPSSAPDTAKNTVSTTGAEKSLSEQQATASGGTLAGWGG